MTVGVVADNAKIMPDQVATVSRGNAAAAIAFHTIGASFGSSTNSLMLKLITAQPSSVSLDFDTDTLTRTGVDGVAGTDTLTRTGVDGVAGDNVQASVGSSLPSTAGVGTTNTVVNTCIG